MSILQFCFVVALCISFSSGEGLDVATALVRSFPANTGVYASMKSDIPFECFTEKPFYVLKSQLSPEEFTSFRKLS